MGGLRASTTHISMSAYTDKIKMLPHFPTGTIKDLVITANSGTYQIRTIYKKLVIFIEAHDTPDGMHIR